MELLLIDGGRGEQGSLYAFIEPAGCDVTGVVLILVLMEDGL